MRLETFSVTGFKNFTEEVTLSDLGLINVIHGENNVGKSNLLEAIHLFFQLLDPSLYNRNSSPSEDSFITDTTMENQLGHRRNEIFHIGNNVPLEIKASLERVKGIGATSIAIRLEQRQKNTALTIKRIESENQEKPRSVLERIYQGTSSSSPQMVLIDDRRQEKGETETNAALLGPIPQTLKIALYDAKESLDPAQYRLWELFVETMAQFSPLKNQGTFVALYDRKSQQANLALQTNGARIPVDLLGSGVQQVVGLVGRLLMTGASIVAVEEPEANLRYTLQRELQRLFKNIVADERGPSQLFFTSHSPAFEADDHFYAMTRSPAEHPVIRRRPVDEARHYTGLDVECAPPGSTAPLSYVSSDGLVLVPEGIRDELGLTTGGGVVFVPHKDTGHVEMLTNEQFYALIEDEDESDGQ